MRGITRTMLKTIGVLGLVATSSASRAAPSVCTACLVGEDAGGWVHQMDGSGSPFDGQPHKEWFAGSCSYIHESCTMMDDDLLLALEVSVTAGDATKLRRLLEDHPVALQLTQDHTFVQVLDCRRSVVARYPLQESLVTELAK